VSTEKPSKSKILVQIGFCIIGVLLAVAGILCIINPGDSLDSITNVVGWILIVTGVATLAFTFTVGQILLFVGGVVGSAVIDILTGLVFLRFDGTVSRFFVILFALLLLFIGFCALISSLIVKKMTNGSKAWLVVLAFAILSFVLGIVSIRDPEAGTAIFMIPVGIVFLAIGAGYIGAAVAIQKASDTMKFFKSSYEEELRAEEQAQQTYFKDVTDEDDQSGNPTA